MHGGHRQRMRERVKEYGLEGLNDHEILEVLLYASQPRVNTNEQAHRLIETFGDLNAVFDSDIESLTKVEGVGLTTAFMLSLIPSISRIYLQGTLKKHKHMNVSDVMHYGNTLFLGETKEVFRVLLLDCKKELISTPICIKGNLKHISIDRRSLLFHILSDSRTQYVFLMHNHPSNNPLPSKSDIEFTNDINFLLEKSGIILEDHLIYCPNGMTYSFCMNGKLGKNIKGDPQDGTNQK